MKYRREVIELNRTSPWTVRDAMRLSKLMHVDHNYASLGITKVRLSEVSIIPCRDYRGNPVRGIDMVQRFGLFAEDRPRRLRNAIRQAVLSRFVPMCGTTRHIPLDSILYAYCEDRFGILDELVDRVGYKNPHFFLDGTLISTPTRREKFVIELYRGYLGLYHGMLSPAEALRKDNHFSLAVG